MDELTQEDWQYIEMATRDRFNAARPKRDEGKPSREFLDQEKRIMTYLMRKAYG